MKRILFFVVFAVLFLSTASLADVGGKFAAGLSATSLYNVGGLAEVYCLGGQAKLMVTDAFGLEGRVFAGDSAGPGQISLLGIYNIDIGNNWLVPYVGVGGAYLDLYTDKISGLTRGSKYTGYLGVLGLNLFVGERLPIFGEIQWASFSGTNLSGIAFGLSYYLAK